MAKELTPIKALKELKKRYGKNFSLNDDERCRVIEAALKEKEKKIIRTITVNKALEQFLIDSCPEVEKKLKALEILKDWFEVIEDENGYHLRTLFDIGRITKEDYDLLKEVLL